MALQVINTDQSFSSSNLKTALLEGAASAGILSLTAINGVALAASSTNPSYATDNVETVVPQGSEVTLQGSGFDNSNGVAVDVFCACAGGKVGPFFINPGNPALSATSITLTLPISGPNALPVGPASFVIINKGSDGSLRQKEQRGVSAGREQNPGHVGDAGGKDPDRDGTGFSTLTVINFCATQKSGFVNLGGMLPAAPGPSR